MKTHPLDTHPAAWSAYNTVLDGMDGAARLYAAVELSETVREIRVAGIRAEHPDLDRRGALARLMLEEFGVWSPAEP
ncbi:MAG: hypothetical protein OEO79_13160 [Gemmatimonadota bacterium]|nr:hypothetical protein [Gemmatimonadota bacterium]